MSDLTDFLLARIAEDEAAARAAIRSELRIDKSKPWRTREEMTLVPDDGVWSADREYVQGLGITIYDEGGHEPEQAQHIARHDPARVLAECEAKRQIVALEEMAPGGYRAMLTEAVCSLAVVYADHPDFRESWRT